VQVTTAWPLVLAVLVAAAFPLVWVALLRGRLARVRRELQAAEGLLAQERLERVWLASRAVTELERPLRLLGVSLDLALRRRRDTAELAASIEDAQREVERLGKLAARILILVEPRKKREDTDLGFLVRAAVEAAKPQAQARQVLLTVDGPERVLASLDTRGVQQALEELLGNAIRVTRYGGKVRVEVAEGSRGKLQVRFTDEGPGFGNALPDSVFDPFLFHRTAPAAGFGLALARKVAREHGGDVALGSPKSGGEVVLELESQ